MSTSEPEKKKFKSSVITDSINSQEFKKLFSRHWYGRQPVDSPTIRIITKPFRLCKIPNFIKNEEFIRELKQELLDVELERRSTDLYQLNQTKDLSKINSKKVCELQNSFLYFANWMQDNTEIKLNGTISMSSSLFRDTDFLLCHDDNMGDRRIAYILYLTKDWQPEDGGSLDLFATDKNGVPDKVIESLNPEYNSLIFFEVTEDSFHQVREIRSDNSRRSINGWFHGPLVKNKKKPRPKIIPKSLSLEATTLNLEDWVAKGYMDELTTEDINKAVEEDSYILIPNFFVENMYKTVSAEVTSEEIVWKRVGPPDIRNYEIAEPDTLPSTLKRMYNMFRNLETILLLKAYTKLDLAEAHSSEGTKSIIGSCAILSLELQRWSQGCYTLLYDGDIEDDGKPEPSEDSEGSDSKTGTLDVFVHFNTKNTPKDLSIDYVHPDDPEGVLINTPYKDNHLYIVFKDATEKRLHRYVNHYAKGYFYTLVCTYQEK